MGSNPRGRGAGLAISSLTQLLSPVNQQSDAESQLTRRACRLPASCAHTRTRLLFCLILAKTVVKTFLILSA